MTDHYDIMWSRWPRQSEIYQTINRQRRLPLFLKLMMDNPYHHKEAGRKFCKEHGL